MFASVQDAIATIRDSSNSSEEYLLACEYLANHRGDLQQRVFICLPGGLMGNDDSVWDRVKAGSEERCSCGNERVFVPLNPRTTYEASSTQLTVQPGKSVYLRPVGGDKASAYVRLEIEQDALTFMDDPFAPFVLSADLFSTKGFKLDNLAEVLPKQTTPPVFVQGKTPIFAINVVDLASSTVTITPDAAVEGFDPDEVPDHDCA